MRGGEGRLLDKGCMFTKDLEISEAMDVYMGHENDDGLMVGLYHMSSRVSVGAGMVVPSGWNYGGSLFV